MHRHAAVVAVGGGVGRAGGPLANLSAYHRLKHSWYAARRSEHAAAAADEVAAAVEGVDEDGLPRPNTMLLLLPGHRRRVSFCVLALSFPD